MSWRIPVGHVKPTDEMAKGVLDVLASGWFSPGPKVAEFEEKFAQAHGVKHAILVNSGTDALRISLAALKEHYGWADGDEVVVPALTFVATVNTVLQVGLKPVFFDVDEHTFLCEGTGWINAITDRTRALIPVHLFGLPCDMPFITDVARRRGIRVIEDSCEAMGVGLAQGKVGSFGDFGCFSTYSCHLIVTGVGGIITTNDDELCSLARSFANHGRDPFFLGGKTGEGKDPAELIKRRFTYYFPGYSARVSEFEAAVGIPQIAELPRTIAARSKIADEIKTSLPREFFQTQTHPFTRTHAHMMFPVVLREPSIDRDAYCLCLEQAGIETRPLMPLLTQPVYQAMWPNLNEKFPVASRLSKRGFYVGCHPGMDSRDAAYMVEKMISCVENGDTVAA